VAGREGRVLGVLVVGGKSENEKLRRTNMTFETSVKKLKSPDVARLPAPSLDFTR